MQALENENAELIEDAREAAKKTADTLREFRALVKTLEDTIAALKTDLATANAVAATTTTSTTKEKNDEGDSSAFGI